MPELPEVEVTRHALAEPLAGARVLGARTGKPLRWPLGCVPQDLAGLRVAGLQRRAKYLWLALQPPGLIDTPIAPVAPTATGVPDAGGLAAGPGLLWHLGMSGSLRLHDAAPPAGPHDHFDLITSAGTLRLTDPRRFGAVVWGVWGASPAQGGVARLLAGLGPEPFDPALTARGLHAALALRRTPIKAALLGGELVVGAGNIYACEALFLAGIDPRTPCRRIGPVRAERLLAALRQVLGAAIAAGGSTLRNFHQPSGLAGDYQAQRWVYDREGQACRRCGSTVLRCVLAQRSTFWCGGCQHH